MRNIWAVARFQLLEGWRQRWGKGLMVMALCLVLLPAIIGGLVSHGRILWGTADVREVLRGAASSGLAIFGVTLYLGVPSLAVQPLGGDFLNGTFYTLLPRAFSRTEIYLGKLLGLVLYFWALTWAALTLMVLLFGLLFGTLPSGLPALYLLLPLQSILVLLLTYLLSVFIAPTRVVSATWVTLVLLAVVLPGVAASIEEPTVHSTLANLAGWLFPQEGIPAWSQALTGNLSASTESVTSWFLQEGWQTYWAPGWAALVTGLGLWRFRRLRF